jgi:hypothetical protein
MENTLKDRWQAHLRLAEEYAQRERERESAMLPCPHSRPHWTICPHCNGVNQMALSAA